jgi:hypothetical protein
VLIGTDALRSWLSLTDSDKTANDKLESLSLAVQDFVQSYTNRKLEATYYNGHQDYSIYDGTGQNWIYTKQYPISWISNVYVDSDRAWTSGSLIASADLVIYWDTGMIYSEAGYFSKGHRNVRIDHIAGYGGSATSSYPLPYDIKQTMIEMTVQAFKEGITGVHSVVSMEETRFIQMLSQNSMWRNTLNSYKNYSKRLEC